MRVSGPFRKQRAKRIDVPWDSLSAQARGETTIEKAGSRMKRPIEAALVGAKRFVFRRKMGSKIDDVESRLRG